MTRLRAYWRNLVAYLRFGADKPRDKSRHDPRVFPIGNRWAVEFLLAGEPTVWCTDKLWDALAFAVNLQRLQV
jgi:hypothetical protein